MYAKIKELADGALELQNKLGMEAALREISEMSYMHSARNMFEDARKTKFGTIACTECGHLRSRREDEKSLDGCTAGPVVTMNYSQYAHMGTERAKLMGTISGLETVVAIQNEVIGNMPSHTIELEAVENLEAGDAVAATSGKAKKASKK